MAAVKSLPTTGMIQIRQKYCYLKVDDQYIHHAFPTLAAHFRMSKPKYFLPHDDIGAHISIIYPEEQVTLQPLFAGQIHSFHVKGLLKACYSEQIYYGFAVDAPSLIGIRSHHQLGSMPTFKGEKILFHITIGVFKPNDHK